MELHLPGHLDRDSPVRLFAHCLSDRYASQRVVADLEEPIIRSHAALELCPLTLPLRSTPCQCAFGKQAIIADLDEAICLVTYVLELRFPGHPDYANSLEKLSLGERLAAGINLGESVIFSRAVDDLCALWRPYG